MTRVHYLRRDKNYQGWGLHTWGGVVNPPDWNSPLPPTGSGADGPYWDIELNGASASVGLLIHRGEEKAAGGSLEAGSAPSELWLAGSEQRVFTSVPDPATLPLGTLRHSHAHWLKGNLLQWRVPAFDKGSDGTGDAARSFTLHFSRCADLHVTGDGIRGGDSVPLRLWPGGHALPPDTFTFRPHLMGCTALEVPEEHLHKVPDIVKCQVALSMADSRGVALDVTGVQLPGVLDDLFTYDGPLGDEGGRLTVWAPTAQRVTLLLRRSGGAPSGAPERVEEVEMAPGPSGTWGVERPREWDELAYRYRVYVYCPWTQRLEVSETTDPYSRACDADGGWTLFVDLDNDERLMPPGWRGHVAPGLRCWSDVSVYELHVRDFSATDESVPAPLRGKYRAFCPEYVSPGGTLTRGLAHLKALQEAGMNHIHLLPTYDFGSAPERERDQAVLKEDLSRYPPDSEVQQARVLEIADRDAFQWGYDPVNYGVPEGSYSTDPDSRQRCLEYREMVAALHGLGYRVVLDVVYNHTFCSGPHDPRSVLDKVVPGYYHRRFENGEICNSTCCNNTASEHAMCERLIVDDIVHWARHYRVDGFRFDIMGHHLVSSMARIRSALDALTLERDGVDGPGMYLYGEAWDFGEMACNQRGRNASQLNLGGTGIGAFNDRMRDGAMGGNPFSSPDFQGYATGLAVAPNANVTQGGAADQRAALLVFKDWVRFVMAGNLRDFEMQISDGSVRRGESVRYHGTAPLAYGRQPCENVVYNSCHDNETLFDQVTLKVAVALSAEARARVCMLAQSLVAFSQGVAFFHAGDDILRSKSLDRDSYNSGDWFNKLDWTLQHNNFGVGLPVRTKNADTWHMKRPLLTQAARIQPSPEILRACAEHFRALLRVRFSTPLFRMHDAAACCKQIHFTNTGPDQVLGLISMELISSESDTSGVYDERFVRVLCVFNSAPEPVRAPFPPAASQLLLHPDFAAAAPQVPALSECGVDAAQRQVVVPGFTAAVFVEPRT